MDIVMVALAPACKVAAVTISTSERAIGFGVGMQRVADWLGQLGLGQYAQHFADNDINFDILVDLTDQDLKEIGIASLGHRRHVLRAIGELGGTSVAAAPGSASAPATLAASLMQPVAQAGQAAGERRHVTVMFCDLVDSTGIAAQLDAEEWRDLVGTYLVAASAAVVEMGGQVAKKLGDGLMALFGYPVGQENDAERAVRAALAIQLGLTELNRRNVGSGKPALAARIAVESGPVVIDAEGEIFGDVPNIASRAQALAEPGAVVVTARVQRQVAGLFVAEERGSHQLKGVPEPVTLFRLVRASGAGRRGGSHHLTPLVGRDEEIAMLMRRWERARHGEGQLLLLSGEAGLGKSRLIEEFDARLRDVPHTWVEWSCSQLLQNTSLHPIAEWGRMRFGSADAEQRYADLENTLALVNLDPAENAPLLAPLLDIAVPPDRVQTWPPDELRRRQLTALINWVMRGARAQPIVLAVEDLHWADPTTLEVLRGIAERGALAPLFVVATMRPEFRPPWGMRSHHGVISLAPLDRPQVRHMVGELASRHALSKDMIEGVTDRSGGVPLFVEELTRLLLERGEHGGIQTIPPTLQQSLTARLDRLGPAREVAQIGAVIGRGFSYALIRAVSGMDDTALQTALERLAEADILLVQGLPPDAYYRFKHALIQDAAYENLLKTRRQALHRRVGELLRDQFADSSKAEPELLAHHFTRAGLAEAACEWWGKAGQRSLERSALAEAAEQFTRALNRIAALPSTPALRREQIKLQVALINPLMHVKGYAAPETKACEERARLLIEQSEALGEPLEDPLLLFSVLYGFWVANQVAFNADVMHELAAKFLGLAKAQEKGIFPLLSGHRLMATSLMFTGDLAASREHFDRVIALYDPAEHRPLATRVGQDVRVAALSYRSWALWMQGYPAAALADVEHAVGDAREIAQAATLMYVRHVTLVPLLHCGQYAAAAPLVEELVELAEQKGAAYWKADGMLMRGCLLALTGKHAEAVPVISAGIAAYRLTGATMWLSWYLSHLAMAHAELGQLIEAWRCIDAAMRAVKTTREKWCEPEVDRIAGEIELKSPLPDVAKAEMYFQRALEVARSQQAKSWELRAAMSLARLWRDQGRGAEGRDLLAAVYGWFSEGFDTNDLKQARILLDALAS
jgi:class 3 adenylate cyclase/predicted ATPase